MSGSTAIGMVSESLRNLLVGEMTLLPEVEITILPPFESGGDRRINLYLYKVEENSALKNLDWQVKRGEAATLVPPPLSLSLFYLMTPYALLDQVAGNATAHELLGEAMRVFYENPVIGEDYLVPGLAGAREEIKIIQRPVEIEEMSTLWSTFSQPYRLSVAYEVSVVQLDMLAESERAMARRVRLIGVPDVRAPFRPPELTAIAPLSGPAGSTVTVSGENLAGWQAYASMMRRTVLAGVELAADTFDLTVPVDFDPGFYEVRIDISHLCRRTFFFEVTP